MLELFLRTLKLVYGEKRTKNAVAFDPSMPKQSHFHRLEILHFI